MNIATDSSILFVSPDPALCRELKDLFGTLLPDARFHSQASVVLDSSEECSIVILDDACAGTHSLEEFMYSLKTLEYEPSTVVLSTTSDPKVVNDFYATGFHRCILREGDWGESLVRSIDQLIRYQRIHQENLKLRSKLTEANMMLVEKNKRLDQFAAGISHDIRGPLATIIMRLEVLYDRVAQKGLQAESDLLEKSLESGNRMIELVQGMYEYAKLGAQLRSLGEVELEELIHEVFVDLNLDSKREVQVAIGDLPPIWGSRRLLRQLMLNLISNSIKYSDTSPIMLSFEFAGWKEMNIAKFAVFHFSDNGPGIPSEEREQVFSFFERGSSDAGRVEGAGLGLAMARRIVELHHGELKLIDPLTERGVRFEIVLPTEPLEYLAE